VSKNEATNEFSNPLFSEPSLFRIISAPMIPGTPPARVRRHTIRIDPQPLSITASGGQITHNITLVRFIYSNIVKIELSLKYNNIMILVDKRICYI